MGTTTPSGPSPRRGSGVPIRTTGEDDKQTDMSTTKEAREGVYGALRDMVGGELTMPDPAMDASGCMLASMELGVRSVSWDMVKTDEGSDEDLQAGGATDDNLGGDKAAAEDANMSAAGVTVLEMVDAEDANRSGAGVSVHEMVDADDANNLFAAGVTIHYMVDADDANLYGGRDSKTPEEGRCSESPDEGGCSKAPGVERCSKTLDMRRCLEKPAQLGDSKKSVIGARVFIRGVCVCRGVGLHGHVVYQWRC